jgi:hypothetical protein
MYKKYAMTSFYINYVRKSLSKKYIEGVFNSIIGERIVKSVKLTFTDFGFNKCIVYFLNTKSVCLNQLIERIKQEGFIAVTYKNEWSNKTRSYNEKYWRVYIHKERFKPRVMSITEIENIANKNNHVSHNDHVLHNEEFMPVEPLYPEEEWIYDTSLNSITNSI